MILKAAYTLASLALKAKAAHDVYKSVSDLIPDSIKGKMAGALTDVNGTSQAMAIEALEKYAPGLIEKIAERNAKPGEPALTVEQLREMMTEAMGNGAAAGASAKKTAQPATVAAGKKGKKLAVKN